MKIDKKINVLLAMIVTFSIFTPAVSIQADSISTHSNHEDDCYNYQFDSEEVVIYRGTYASDSVKNTSALLRGPICPICRTGSVLGTGYISFYDVKKNNAHYIKEYDAILCTEGWHDIGYRGEWFCCGNIYHSF